jgi:3-hydroxyacyl-CoA dehydrogenase
MPDVRTIAVIGPGVMGRGIAYAAALAGHRTILEGILPASLRKAEDEIRAIGPLEMIDQVGLDTRLHLLENLHKSLGEKFRPCPLMVQYVKAGRLGRKSGRGVYEYPEPSGSSIKDAADAARKSAGAKES